MASTSLISQNNADTIENGRRVAASYNSVEFICTSSKTGKNVMRCFHKLTKMIMIHKNHSIVLNDDNLSETSE